MKLWANCKNAVSLFRICFEAGEFFHDGKFVNRQVLVGKITGISEAHRILNCNIYTVTSLLLLDRYVKARKRAPRYTPRLYQ